MVFGLISLYIIERIYEGVIKWMGDYDLDTNMNTMNVQFCNGKDHQDFQEFVYVHM